MKSVRAWVVVGLFGGILTLALLLAQAFLAVGYLPFEILQYVDRRLEGHPRLQWGAAPVLDAVRWVDAKWGSGALPRARQPEPEILSHSPLVGGTLVSATPGIWVQHQGRRFRVRDLAEAAHKSLNGDVVWLQPGVHDTRGAVWRGKSVTLQGEGGKAWLRAQPDVAEGKALLVLGGGDFEVRHLGFVGVKVGDKNGSGIRFEGGRLQVDHCAFLDSESGILINSDAGEPTTEVRVSFTEFARLGDGLGYAHAVYAGRIRLLELRGNHFHHGREGHLVKSRAQESRLLSNRITDELGGQASYELNFPNGGRVVLVGNVIGQSRSTRNGAVLSMLEEGHPWPRNELHAVHNTWVNLHPFGGRFLQVAGSLSGGQVWRNLVVGRGNWRVPEGLPAAANLRVGLDEVHDAQAFDVRPAHWQADWVADGPPLIDDPMVQTLSEAYRHPMRVEPLVKGRALLVGAAQ